MPHVYHTPGDVYIVTGRDRTGKRFRVRTDNPHYALGINLWQGSVWQVRQGSFRRTRIKRV